jgi:hypothetical protein
MSLILWYKVVIEENSAAGGLLAGAASLLGLGLPVTVSSDVYSGSYILDATINLEMKSGATASTFEVKLINLPKDLVNTIKDKQKSGLAQKPPQPLQVKVFLGYLEDLPLLTATDPVMVGAVRRLKSEVNGNGLLETTLIGEEISGYKLRTKTAFEKSWPGQTAGDQVLKDILQDTSVDLADGHGLSAIQFQDFTLKEGNRLLALNKFAQQKQVRAPLVIRDQKLFIKDSVGAGAPVATFSADENLVSQLERQENEEITDEPGKKATDPITATARTAQQVVVLGNPKLRAGQQVTLKLPDDTSDTYRIINVKHSFSNVSGGYTCVVLLVHAEPGKLAEVPVGVEALADTLQNATTRPASSLIDVGQVKSYTAGKDKHVATLDYGQSPQDDSVAASVQTPVDETVQLINTPMLAPFAFHKTGLIVPTYPKMRVLLAHNRGEVRDAVIAGFLWSNEPAYERPQSQAGDYWLCLPTELDNDGLPTGKGANDLTDSAGRRIIQTKAFQIFVADDQLPAVGVRPTPPDASTLVIEHQSGAKITIDKDGKITIETKSKELALTNGSVTLSLNGSTVEVK